MSELISGKEALIALANGEEIEYQVVEDRNVWNKVSSMAVNLILSNNFKFRLKPRTITLNGVKVEQLYSSQWCKEKPDEVTLKFKNKNAAMFFQSKALEIFNGIK